MHGASNGRVRGQAAQRRRGTRDAVVGALQQHGLPQRLDALERDAHAHQAGRGGRGQGARHAWRQIDRDDDGDVRVDRSDGGADVERSQRAHHLLGSLLGARDGGQALAEAGEHAETNVAGQGAHASSVLGQGQGSVTNSSRPRTGSARVPAGVHVAAWAAAMSARSVGMSSSPTSWAATRPFLPMTNVLGGPATSKSTTMVSLGSMRLSYGTVYLVRYDRAAD